MNFLKNCNKDNALALLGIYASIDEERFPGFEKQRDLVKKAVAANKHIILEKLNSLRDTLLPPPEKGEKNGFYKPKTTITEDEKLLIPHIVKNGVEHYAIIEKTANFLDMVMKSEDPETHMQTQLALSKIAKYRSLDEKQERYKTADYREVDLSEFYEKSCSLQKTDAKVFLEFLRCFNTIQKDTENFKTMQNGPMMKIIVMLGLMQSAQKMNTENILKSLKNLESRLKKSPNSKAQLEFIKEFDTECNNTLSQLFQTTLGLKNLPAIDKKLMPYLTTHLTYLNNINNVDEFKKNIIAFFLVLHLTNQWQSFKKGENIKYEQYFEDKDVEKIKEYLGKKKRFGYF